MTIFVATNNRKHEKMIEYLRGRLADLTPALAVVDCGGVGYGVNISHTIFVFGKKNWEKSGVIQFKSIYSFATTKCANTSLSVFMFLQPKYSKIKLVSFFIREVERFSFCDI